MKRKPIKLAIILISVILGSCAGTINTVNYVTITPQTYKKAIILSPENSKYVEFKFGTIHHSGFYVPPVDDAPVDREIVGNTPQVIKNELQKYNIDAIIAEKDSVYDDVDLIVKYYDIWRWDFKDVLQKLEIQFISPIDGSILAKTTYNIYHNTETHNFPTPEKEVPKMFRELINE